MSRTLYLDGWRGCAILTVIVGHFFPLSMLNMGRFGVELFFILSGRLMAEILFERRVAIRSFLFRRISRIYPVLIVYVAASTLAVILLGRGDQLPQALAAATLTFNYFQIYGEPVSGPGYLLAHIWSLCVEEHMYILLASLAFLSRHVKFPVRALIGVIAALFIVHGIVRTWVGLDYYAVYWRSDIRGASILIGSLAYLYRNQLRAVVPFSPAVLVVAGFIFNLDIFPDPVKYSLGTTALAVGLTKLATETEGLATALKTPALITMGLWSYSLYLWQQPLFLLNNRMMGSDYAFLISVVLVSCVFLFGFASFKLVETPLRRALNAWQAEKLAMSSSSKASHVSEVSRDV